MKYFTLPILVLSRLAPAVQAADSPQQRFEHDGRIYSYSVTQVGYHRGISGKPFRLRVGDTRVRGTAGSQEINFALSKAVSLNPPVTTIAAR